MTGAYTRYAGNGVFFVDEAALARDAGVGREGAFKTLRAALLGCTAMTRPFRVEAP